MKRFYLILIALLIGNISSLMAQSPRGKFGFGILLGGSRIYGDLDKATPRLSGGATFRVLPVSFLGLTTRFTYNNLRSGLNATNTDLFNASIFASLFLLPKAKFSPFLNLGYSRYYFKTGAILDGVVPLSKWGDSFLFGGGLEFFVANRWAINTTLDYYFAQNDLLDGIVSARNDGFLTGFLGLMFYFTERRNEVSSDLFVQSYENSQATGSTYVSQQKPVNNDESEIKEIKSQSQIAAAVDELENSIQTDAATSHPETEAASSSPSTSSNSQIIQIERVPNGLYFESGSDKILNVSKQKLQKIYEFLTQNPDLKIELKDFRNPEQNSEFDRQIAYRRALAVKNYLVNLGIDPQRLIIKEQP
ncbi:MAG: hypothetical protein D6813_11460 [Calditrichaeota bacterium]|nr:MAG: hypothetical protein D6813_11460 [Calditrichota bacterium]